MTATKEDGRFSFQKPVRLLWPALDVPKAMIIGGKPKGDPQYSVRLLIPADHPEVKALSAAIAKAKAAKFGAEVKGVAMPFQMGDAMADKWAAKGKKRDFVRGHIVLKASSGFPPALGFVSEGGIIGVDDDERVRIAKSKFYSGVEAVVGLNFVGFDGNGENIPNCVKAYVNSVVSLGKGERIGGMNFDTQFAEFSKSLGTVSDEDPTASADLDDEIPF